LHELSVNEWRAGCFEDIRFGGISVAIETSGVPLSAKFMGGNYIELIEI
jgi:hypothetical protein